MLRVRSRAVCLCCVYGARCALVTCSADPTSPPSPAQTLAKLHHRNIVQFYGACLETGSMFFVTELMKARGGLSLCLFA